MTDRDAFYLGVRKMSAFVKCTGNNSRPIGGPGHAADIVTRANVTRVTSSLNGTSSPGQQALEPKELVLA